MEKGGGYTIMPVVGDRIKIVLKQPYTKTEIKEFGCHPDIDGKKGTVINIEEYWKKVKLYKIKLDEIMQPHELHKYTEFNEPFDIYKETSESIELIYERRV
ncbi:hypothetical protein [Paenibacillus medicaginis]|uniref:Uncharacterized protein n=1 Tax=Paenibacillus medicaginis TaxID=1470560 RepID=A0ABV5BXX7_9BACL